MQQYSELNRTNKKIKITAVLLAVVIFMLLTSCGVKEAENDFFSQSGNDKIFLIDRYNQKPVYYNLKTREKQVGYEGGENNTFAYSFNDNDDYFTIGDSVYNNFKLYQNDGKNVELLYSEKGDKGLFALCGYKNYLIMSQNSYQNDEITGVQLAVFDTKTKEMKTYNTDNRNYLYAVAVDGYLYCDSCDEKDDNYILWKYKLDNLNEKPEKICTLQQGELYKINNEVYISDKNKIKPLDGSGKTYKYKEHTYFIKDKYMLQYVLDSSGSLQIIVKDMKTDSKIDTIDEPVGFTFEDKKLVIYSDKGEKSYGLD